MKATSNAHLKTSLHEQVITAVKVTIPTERLQCLPQVAGKDCVVLEHTVYDMLSLFSEDYDGGYWDFFRLSNDGFYMAPKEPKSYRMRCAANGFEGEVDANMAGIIATAMAYSHLSFRPRGECFAIAYERLSAFILQHPDAGMIRAAID
jgi:hypothetical protein